MLEVCELGSNNVRLDGRPLEGQDYSTDGKCEKDVIQNMNEEVQKALKCEYVIED